MSRDPRAVEIDLATYYDQEADARAKQPLEGPRLRARDQFITRLPKKTARLLEIGTGAGRDTGYFVEHGVDTYGIDLSTEQLRHAASRGGLVVLASVRSLPFADESFDAAWTMSTLMHVPDTAIVSALAELRRVLSPNAVAGIGVWGGPDVETLATEEKYSPPRLFSRRSDGRWQGMLASVGRIEEFRTWGDDGVYWYQWAVVRREE